MKTHQLLRFFSTIWIAISVCHVNLQACTAIYTKTVHGVLVGNNEDGANPETKIWFIPAKDKKYGRMYVGYNDASPQGGVNEKGLWFDAFGLPYREVHTTKGDIYSGDLHAKLLEECATVDEVLTILKRYSRLPMTRYQWMFGDRTGASVIIEGDSIIMRKGRYQVVTNFRHSVHPDGEGYECGRFRIATDMLKARPHIGLNGIRSILSATHSEGQDVTLYSYIVNLTQGIVYLYHFHNFEEAVVLELKKELSKGEHMYDLPELFSKTSAAESFYYKLRTELANQKSARYNPDFNTATYPDHCGRFSVQSPEILAHQTLTFTTADNRLYIQINEGGKLEVLPDSRNSFFLLNYGWDFSITFTRDHTGKVVTLSMKGNGLDIMAARVN